jgi:hypothetical protein
LTNTTTSAVASCAVPNFAMLSKVLDMDIWMYYFSTRIAGRLKIETNIDEPGVRLHPGGPLKGEYETIAIRFFAVNLI